MIQKGELSLKKYENFCSALSNLEEIYQYQEPYSNVVLTGLTGLFEICFEQSWKMMKEILSAQGFEECQSGSPRQIIKVAYKAAMIEDEDLWLSALASRNNVSHAYNKGIALDIVHKTKESYTAMFRNLKQQVEERWL